MDEGAARLPDGVVVEAAPPDGLVVLWANAPAPSVLDALAAGGQLSLVLDPSETAEFVEHAGPPAMLLVAAERLDEAGRAALAQVRVLAPRTRIVLLAGQGTSQAGLLGALREGIAEVADPDDAAAVHALVAGSGETPRERVLAVGAHPDDVEIGCGGTLLRHRDHGEPVTVLTLSRGAAGGSRELRRQEAVGAAVTLAAELLMADLPDTRLEDAHEMVTIIEDVIAVVRPTTVYVHSDADNHQDHRAVHRATVIAARRVPHVLCYQSPSSRNGFAPTRFIPVTDTLDRKLEVLSHYRSQSTRHYLEPDLVVATARYWARQLPHLKHAEPFEVLRTSG